MERSWNRGGRVKPQPIIRGTDENETTFSCGHAPDLEANLQWKFNEGWEVAFRKGGLRGGVDFHSTSTKTVLGD